MSNDNGPSTLAWIKGRMEEKSQIVATNAQRSLFIAEHLLSRDPNKMFTKLDTRQFLCLGVTDQDIKSMLALKRGAMAGNESAAKLIVEARGGGYPTGVTAHARWVELARSERVGAGASPVERAAADVANNYLLVADSQKSLAFIEALVALKVVDVTMSSDAVVKIVGGFLGVVGVHEAELRGAWLLYKGVKEGRIDKGSLDVLRSGVFRASSVYQRSIKPGRRTKRSAEDTEKRQGQGKKRQEKKRQEKKVSGPIDSKRRHEPSDDSVLFSDLYADALPSSMASTSCVTRPSDPLSALNEALASVVHSLTEVAERSRASGDHEVERIAIEAREGASTFKVAAYRLLMSRSELKAATNKRPSSRAKNQKKARRSRKSA